MNATTQAWRGARSRDLPGGAQLVAHAGPAAAMGVCPLPADKLSRGQPGGGGLVQVDCDAVSPTRPVCCCTPERTSHRTHSPDPPLPNGDAWPWGCRLPGGPLGVQNGPLRQLAHSAQSGLCFRGLGVCSIAQGLRGCNVLCGHRECLAGMSRVPGWVEAVMMPRRLGGGQGMRVLQDATLEMAARNRGPVHVCTAAAVQSCKLTDSNI